MVASDVTSHQITPHKPISKLVASQKLHSGASYPGASKLVSMQTPKSDAGVNRDNHDNCDASTFCSSSASDITPPSLVEEEDTEDMLTPLHPTHNRIPQKASYGTDDHDEDDEEMIQYNNKSEYTAPNFKTGSVVSLRRTPGANDMHRSALFKDSTLVTSLDRSIGAAGNRDLLRRTPGANAMYRSVAETHTGNSGTASLSNEKCSQAVTSSNIRALSLDQDNALENKTPSMSNSNTSKLCKDNNERATILEYGLATPSPLASRGKLRNTSDHEEALRQTEKKSICVKTNEPSITQDEDFTLSHATSYTTKTISTEIACTPATQSNSILQNSSIKSRPPRDPNSTTGRQNYLYTPAGVSLAKNRDLNLHASANGTMSPNTIQLATSIDNLLDDGEGNVKRCEEKECKGRNELRKDVNSPLRHQKLSFKPDSGLSNRFSSEDWHESYTLESNSLQETTMDAQEEVETCMNVPCNTKTSITSTVTESDSPFCPKPLHSSFHRFTRTSSEISANSRCKPSSSDVTPVKDYSSSPRPANFSSVGAFSPPTKPTTSQPNGERTYVHAPTPKKACDTNSASNYQYHHTSQKEGLEDHCGYYGDGVIQPTMIHHHFHCNIPPFHNCHPAMYDTSYDPNMYPFQSEFIRGPALPHSIPSPLPFQHQPHVSVNSTHVDCGQRHHHVPHPSTSPVPSVVMSPGAYPIHGGMQYQSLSPVPFSQQHVIGAVAWSGHDVHECQSHNQWGTMGTGTGWEQPAHLSPDYAFNGVMYPTNGAMGPPIMSTSTPPPMSSYLPWMLSEYEGYNGTCTAHGPASMEEITHHNMVSNQNASYPLQHIAEEDSAVQQHSKCAMRYVEGNVSDGPTNPRPPPSYEEYPGTGANGYVNESMANNPQYQGLPRDSVVYTQGQHAQNVHESANREEEKSSIKLIKLSSKKYQRGSSRNKVNSSIMESSDESAESLTKKEKLTLVAEVKSKKKVTDSKRRNKENQGRAMNACNMKSAHVRKCKKKTGAGKKSISTGYTTEMKKVEVMDNHAARVMLKDFYRTFRLKEKVSLNCAAEFAKLCLSNTTIPESMHWRIYLELADLAKRGNNVNQARQLYYKVCNLQPHVSQGWLEFSKLEEEYGNLDHCSQLLSMGLQFCKCNENLLTRAIKHEERMAYEHGNGDLSRARELLAPLKHSGIDKIWRTVLEGAMMESRAGNNVVARRVLKYLMHWVPWYGPLYSEAFRLERDAGRSMKALIIVERGLKEIPRYGPLWFGAFRLYEGLDLEQKKFDLPQTMNMIERATVSISSELIWKVHLEAAQAQERAAHQFVTENEDVSLNQKLDMCRQSYVKTICACPKQLCWKIWLAAGRMELSAGRFEEARRLFLKSFSDVPCKGRLVVLLECSRLEEFVGNVKLARAILCKSRVEGGSDWKVFLESISLEVRCGNREDAILLAQKGLNVHSGTGRLWAALVQLREADGEELQMDTLKQSLTAVPKSGEVWCEAARMFLNPLSSIFDVAATIQHLDFATKFTPQYGDSFIENLRLIFLQRMIKTIGFKLVNKMKENINRTEWQSHTNSHDLFFSCVGTSIQQAVGNLNTSDIYFDNVDTSQLELRCSNADPNYGKLWFHCRQKSTDTARTVLRRAKESIAQDLSKHAHVYMSAIMRRAAVEILVHSEQPKSQSDRNERDCHNQTTEKKKMLNLYLRSSPSVQDLITNNQNNASYKGIQHLDNNLSSANFVTGLIELNKNMDLQCLSLVERRRVLFGSQSALMQGNT